MKITGYSQQVTNVGGASSAPTLNLSASAKVAGSAHADLSPIAKGLGTVANTVNYIHEQEDRKNVLAAMDSYNQQMNDLLHNEKDGLLNQQLQGAEGISDRFAQREQEIRQQTLGGAKLHFQGNRNGLMHNLSSSAQQNMQRVAQWQLKQNEAVADVHLGNVVESNLKEMQENYNDPAVVQSCLQNIRNAGSLRHAGKGPEFMEKWQRETLGNVGNNLIQTALANNDYGTLDKLYKDFGPFLSGNQRTNYEKLSYKKQADQWKRSMGDSILAEGGSLAEMLAKVDGVNTRTVNNINGGNSSLVDKVRSLKGKISFYAPDGTNCMRTMGMALAGTPYEGQINVNQAIATAKQNGQLITDPNYKPKPGDLAVNEDGNHIVMVTENGGTIQNGKSQNGVYESNSTAAQMSSDGKVKYYIRTSDYNNTVANNTIQNVDEEEREALRNYIISKHNRNIQIENANRKMLQDDIMQQCYEAKQNGMDAQSAIAKFADSKLYSNVKDYDAACAAVAHVFGTSTSAAKGLKGLRTSQGKGDEMAVYEMKKLIEANAFEGDRTTLMNYLNSTECSDLKDSQKRKVIELFDDFTDKKGAYKYDWSKLNNRILNGAKLPADEKERMLAQGQAYALNMIKTWKPAEHQGRPEPTDEEVIAAAQEGVNKNYMTTYEEEGRLWGTNTKELSVSAGALARAGFYGGMADQPGTDMVTLYYDAEHTRAVSVSKDVLRSMFPDVKK